MLMFVIVCAKVVNINYGLYYVAVSIVCVCVCRFAVSIRLREVLTHQSLPVIHERQPPRCKIKSVNYTGKRTRLVNESFTSLVVVRFPV